MPKGVYPRIKKPHVIRYRCIDCFDEVSSNKATRCRPCQDKFKIMNKHHNWNGGRYKSQDGYIMRYCLTHPNRNEDNYVLEHRLVMEGILNRRLEKGEIVHHLNNIKDDNRPENLIVIGRKEHINLHRKFINSFKKGYKNEKVLQAR